MSHDFSGTKPVSERHAFDTERLALYLRDAIEGFPRDPAAREV